MLKNRNDLAIHVGTIFNTPCFLCECEQGTMLKRSYGQENGVALNYSVVFCARCFEIKLNDCIDKFEQAWEAEWTLATEKAEKNWTKYGIYTNIEKDGKPSTLDGYAKLPDGIFKRYRSLHPETPLDVLVADLDELCDKYVGTELLSKVDEYLVNSPIEQPFKDKVRENFMKFYDARNPNS